MAMLRTSTATVRNPNIGSSGWLSRTAATKGSKQSAVKENIIAKYSPDKWLLSHVSIMASVDTDLADPNDPKSNWLIRPEHSIFVNNNGDCWERDLLAKTYMTFLGANNYCFVAGTRVLMADGTYKPIEGVCAGDRVIDRLGRPAKVLDTFSHEADNLTKVRSASLLSREITTTADHPFWVFRARETCPKTGRPNKFDLDKAYYALDSWVGFSQGVHKRAGESYPCGVAPAWAEAGNLNPSRDFLTKPVSSIEVPHKDMNANRAFLVGWFLAEGSFMYTNAHHDGESGVQFSLCAADEQPVADEIKRLLEIEFGHLFRKNSGVRFIYPESTIQVELSNIKVAAFFKKWCGKWSWAKKMPAEAMLLPKELQATILMNCMHGDGCGTLTSRGYKLGLKSRDLIQQLLFISWRLGLNPTYAETGVLPRYTEKETVGGFDIYTDPDTGKKSRPGYLLSYTTEDSRALESLGNVKDTLMGGQSVRKRTIKMANDEGSWILGKIDSVERVPGVETVYNFEVEGDNSYVVEGVVVHNCEHVQIPELAKGKVVDVALREVPLGKNLDGKPYSTLYVDLLVATSREHEQLCRQIETGEFNAMSMGCFVPGTMITMSDGTKRRIEDVQPGDMVITHTGERHRVINTQIRQKSEDLYRIEFEGGIDPLLVTKEHPFFAHKKERVCACGCGELMNTKLRGGVRGLRTSNYKTGHYARVCNPNKGVLKEGFPGTTSEFKLSWVEAENLRVGDLLSYPKGSPDARVRGPGPELSRLLGYFLAEGSYVKEVSCSGENEYAVSCRVCGSSYNTLVPHVKTHGLTVKQYGQMYPGAPIKADRSFKLIRGGRASSAPSGIVKGRKLIGLEFSLGAHEYNTLNAEISNLAKSLWPDATVLRYEKSVKVISADVAKKVQGLVGEYSDRKKLSEEVLYWPVDDLRHLLAAWFIGDYACTVSKDLHDQFRLIAARCGVRVNAFKTIGKQYTCTSRGKAYSGQKKDSFLLQINTLGMDVLRPYLRYSFDFQNKKLVDTLKRVSDTYAAYGPYDLRKVKSIDKVSYEGLVYNMEVEGDNSYIANDVAVHNCLIQYSQCSRCGNIAKDETEACKHVKYYKGNEFYDSNGRKRIIAELCGHKDDPESVKFIDASWVKNPAFPGAVLRNIVSPPTMSYQNARDELLDSLANNKSIVDDEHHAIMKSASLLDRISRDVFAEDAPVDDSAFPETPPTDTTPVDTEPAEDKAPEGGSEEDSGGGFGGGFGGGEGEEGGGEEEPEVSPEEAQKTPMEDIQEEIQDALLTQVKQKLMVQTMQLSGIGTGEGPGRGGNSPYDLENSTNTSLVKEAASSVTAKYLWDRYSIDVNSLPNRRLAGAIMLSTRLGSMKELKKFGFSHRDAVGLLHFMDLRVSSDPLPREAVEFLSTAKSKGMSKKAFFEDYIISTGSIPSVDVARKVWKWAKLLGDA